MKTNNSFIAWASILCIFMVSLIFLDAMAMSDIYHDYVSIRVLESIQLNVSNLLPDWSQASGEWAMLVISLILKLIFTIFILIALVKTTRK